MRNGCAQGLGSALNWLFLDPSLLVDSIIVLVFPFQGVALIQTPGHVMGVWYFCLASLQPYQQRPKSVTILKRLLLSQSSSSVSGSNQSGLQSRSFPSHLATKLSLIRSANTLNLFVRHPGHGKCLQGGNGDELMAFAAGNLSHSSVVEFGIRHS